MRNLVLSAILLFLGGTAIADDAWMSATGGIVSPMTAEHQSIQLVRERITLTLHDDYYSVLVSSVFYNFGETTTIQVGFPEFSAGGQPQETREFRDFETEVDGRKIQFQRKKADADSGSGKENWYVKDVQFPKSDYTTTTVKYSTPYGMWGALGSTVNYLFGTGLTWKGEIKEVEFVVRNEAGKLIMKMWEDVGDKRYSGPEIADRHFLNAIDRNTFRIKMFNIEPLSLKDSITILYSGYYYHPFRSRAHAEEHYYFDKKPISSFYLNVLTKKELRIARNIIYAWHGYSFRSPDLQSLFAGWFYKDWYKVNPDFADSDLNQQERMNIDTILEEEILREAKDLGL